MIDGVTTLFAFMFVVLVIVCCITHYEGPINLCRRIGLYWLEVADNMEARHKSEDVKIFERLKKVRIN